MFEQVFKNIDDVLWKEAGCTTELDYTEQSSWLLFLKYLDGLEADLADEAALAGKKYRACERTDDFAVLSRNHGQIECDAFAACSDMVDQSRRDNRAKFA